MTRSILGTWLSKASAWLREDDEGQTIAEYGLLLAGLAIFAVAAGMVVIPWLVRW